MAPKRSWDKFDEEASREGSAIREARSNAGNTVLGRRIAKQNKLFSRGESIADNRATRHIAIVNKF